jgi:cytochrome c oxidase cbb3-type subunit 3
MADQLDKQEENQSNKDFNDHEQTHEYDGIKELNNPPPAWIIIIFLVTIGFSLIYAVHYFSYPDNKMDQDSIYARKTSAFDEEIKQRKAAESGEQPVLTEEEMALAGKKLYDGQGCLACHGINGEGNNIGPNLADNFWIHGCSEEDVTRIIREGNPLKGMTAFGNKMTEEQMNSVTKYILLTLKESNPENAKGPEGEACN